MAYLLANVSMFEASPSGDGLNTSESGIQALIIAPYFSRHILIGLAQNNLLWN